MRKLKNSLAVLIAGFLALGCGGRIASSIGGGAAGTSSGGNDGSAGLGSGAGGAGTACQPVYNDISAGQGPKSGLGAPSAVIDASNEKLLVVTANGANFNKPALVRCNLDGRACTYNDISAGADADSGWTPSAVIDTTNGKLLVVTAIDAPAGLNPSFFRCNLDGTACTHSSLPGEGFSPTAMI